MTPLLSPILFGLLASPPPGRRVRGSYRVTATNAEGAATSGVCRFRITRQAPTITTNLLPLYESIAGSPLTLSVDIAPAAYPLPTDQGRIFARLKISRTP